MSPAQAPTSTQPPQAQQWIVIAALAACLLVGGGIVYWFVFGGPSKTRIVKVDPATQKPAARPRQLAANVPGITRIRENDWTARGVAGAVRIKRGGNGALDFDYWFVTGFSPSREQIELISAAQRATRDDAMAADWGITKDQLKQVRKALAISAPKLTSEERAALGEEFQQYLNASEPAARTEAQRKFTAKLDEVVKAKLQPSQEALDQKVRELKQILSADQVNKMTQK